MKHRKRLQAPSSTSDTQERDKAQQDKLHQKPAGKSPGNATVVSAFDVWLERGLHKLFDDVASEPIPPELLRLIEDDRHRSVPPPDPSAAGPPDAPDKGT